jgi:hypothetical protein
MRLEPRHHSPSSNLGTRRLATGALIALLILTAIFQHWTSTWAFPRFVVATVLLIWLPGRFVLDSLRVEAPALERFLFAMVLGMLTSTAVYWLLSVAGVPWLTIGWVAVAAVFTIWRLRLGESGRGQSVALRLEHGLLAAIVCAGLAIFALLPDYWRNVSEQPDGSLRAFPVDDVVFHLSLTRELTHTVPPEVPYLSGTELTYHYGMDIVGAMLAKFSGVNVLDVTVRFLPTLFLLTTAIATYAFARAWLRSGVGAALATTLVLFGEDLSFLFGFFKHSKTVWSAQFFEVPAVFGLFYVNPMLIALGIFMAALLALYRWLDGGNRAWAAIAGFSIAFLWEFKVFVALLAFAALAVTGVALRPRGSRLLVVLGVSTVVVLPLALYTTLGTEARGLTSTAVAAHPYVANALRATGFRIDDVASGLPRLVLLAVVGAPFYFACNLGARLIGLPSLASGRFRLPTPRGMRPVLVVVIVLGTLLTFATRISLKADPVRSYDNAVWFYVAAKYLMWILAVEVVVIAWSKRRNMALGLAGLMILVSIPSTIQFVSRVRDTLLPERITSDEVRLLEDLDQRCSGATVTLPEVQLVKSMVTLTDCETPAAPVGYASLFSASLMNPVSLNRRLADVNAFWKGWKRQACDAAIVMRYQVRYVIAHEGVAPPSRCGSLGIERVYAQGQYATYLVSDRA